MDPAQTGHFITYLRKEKQMTQKDLASLLGITDKAVSKWERGLSFPDVTLLPLLSKSLGVTVEELLEPPASVPEAALPEPPRRPLGWKRAYTIWILLGTLFLGILPCIICDLALTGELSWSLFPISSCLFTGLSIAPLLLPGRKGEVMALGVYTLLLPPYLLYLTRLVGSPPLMRPIALGCCAIWLPFFWLTALLLWRDKGSHVRSVGFALLLVIPFAAATNLLLSHFLGEPLVDVWDVLTCLALAGGGISCLRAGSKRGQANP